MPNYIAKRPSYGSLSSLDDDETSPLLHNETTCHQDSVIKFARSILIHNILAHLHVFQHFLAWKDNCFPYSYYDVLKRSNDPCPSEAATLAFVAEHTNIPVPKVVCAFEHNGQAYTLMRRIRGKRLSTVLGKLDDTARARISDQLRGIYADMRRLTAQPWMGVANVGNGPLRDPGLLGVDGLFGPFDSVDEFHIWLDQHDAHPRFKEVTKEVAREVDVQTSKGGTACQRLVFTHGNLTARNIMVKGDQVVGILNWEAAGWYPPYWERLATRGLGDLIEF